MQKIITQPIACQSTLNIFIYVFSGENDILKKIIEESINIKVALLKKKTNFTFLCLEGGGIIIEKSECPIYKS